MNHCPAKDTEQQQQQFWDRKGNNIFGKCVSFQASFLSYVLFPIDSLRVHENKHTQSGMTIQKGLLHRGTRGVLHGPCLWSDRLWPPVHYRPLDFTHLSLHRAQKSHAKYTIFVFMRLNKGHWAVPLLQALEEP